MENTTDEPSMIVQTFHEDKLQEFIPVIIILSLVSVCGLVGNAFTIGFYGFHTKWTPTVLMITALAIVDLFICLILVHAILEIGINVYYTNRVTCKLFHFLVHWAMASSALILWLVSIDRYRRICRPLQKQIDIALAKKLVVGAVSFGCLLSIRDFVNFDIIEFDLDDTSNSTSAFGHYCTTTDNPDLKISVIIFLGLDALLIVMVMVTLVFTYANIVMVIVKAGKQSSDDTSTCKGVNGEKGSDNPKPYIENSKTSTSATSTDTDRDHYTDDKKLRETRSTKPGFKTNLKQSERSITFLMFLVSLGFFCCFVPYFIIKMGIRSVIKASELELGAGTQFSIRLVYVNSVLNPLIFCAFNPQFRRYVKNMISRCKPETKYEVNSSSVVALSTGKEQLSSE